MKIAITGASGLIGSYVTKFFRDKHNEVLEISRSSGTLKPVKNKIYWNPSSNAMDLEKLEGTQVVIHLAGASIASRWTTQYKSLLRASRINSTRLLSQSLAKLKSKPKLLISASAIGYYGNHFADKKITEADKPAQDFLAQLCQDWEKETQPAQEAGIRVIHLRTGIVLSKNGGALAKMLPIFNLAFGGVLGSGEQMMSWIALAEIPHVIEHLITHSDVAGPVNLVSPKPVSNKDFTKVLGEVIHRPVVLPVPAFGIKTLFGEMGQALLLEGAGVYPRKLLDSGYVFRYDNLKLALIAALK